MVGGRDCQTAIPVGSLVKCCWIACSYESFTDFRNYQCRNSSICKSLHVIHARTAFFVIFHSPNEIVGCAGFGCARHRSDSILYEPDSFLFHNLKFLVECRENPVKNSPLRLRDELSVYS